MRISLLKLHSIAIADPPLRSSYGLHAAWALRTIIEIETDDGITGISETYGGDGPRAALEAARQSVIGRDPFQLAGLQEELCRETTPMPDVPGGRSQTWLVPGENPLDQHNRTFAAVEIACLDLIGKAVGRPVCDVIGGRVRDRVPFSAYLFYKHAGGGGDGRYEDEYGEVLDARAVVRECSQMIQKYGFREIKLKGGVLDPALEVKTIRALRREFGPNVALRIDPNCAWSVDTSVLVGETLREELSGGGYLEDPCPGLEGMSEVKRKLRAKGINTQLASNVAVTQFPDVMRAHAQASPRKSQAGPARIRCFARRSQGRPPVRADCKPAIAPTRCCNCGRGKISRSKSRLGAEPRPQGAVSPRLHMPSYPRERRMSSYVEPIAALERAIGDPRFGLQQLYPDSQVKSGMTIVTVKSLLAGTLLLLGQIAFAQESATMAKSLPVNLRVEAGRPLRLYITHRAWYRMNEAVDAKFAEPVWAFDRIVIPAGTVVHGQVTKLDPVPGMMRARAIVGGDFTPLKRAEVSFTSLTLADGRTLRLETQSSLGLSTIYVPARAKKPNQKQKINPGKPNRVGQFLKLQAQAQMNTRSRGFFDLIRGPNKREWVENFLLEKLPYHPQWYRAGTRFDAVLEQPLDFGKIVIGSADLQALGTQPPPDAIAQMRILSNLSSSDARVGDSMDAVLSEPLFSADHKLVLPQGTRLDGKITLARPARLLHRGGQLRFAIENLEIPSLAAEQSAQRAAPTGLVEPVQAQLTEVEADPGAVKVDREGTAKATESKTRLLRPVIAALVAAKSLDNDTGKQTASGTSGAAGANTSGRALGGFSGFGLLGIAAARGPREIGAALGFYGLAWSVYSNVIARGREVTFEKNTAMAIRFGAPPRKR